MKPIPLAYLASYRMPPPGESIAALPVVDGTLAPNLGRFVRVGIACSVGDGARRGPDVPDPAT